MGDANGRILMRMGRELRLRYWIAGTCFAAMAVALLGLAFYGFFLSRATLHFEADGGHYQVHVRYVAVWASFASFLSVCGFRYCGNRARNRVPGPADDILFQMAKCALGLATLYVLAYLLIPLP